MTSTPLRVAVVPGGERERRAVHALAADPNVAEVGLLDQATPSTWPNARRIESLDGWDVVLAPDAEALRLASSSGVAAVTPGEPDHAVGIPVVTHASPPGLARSLAVAFGLEDARIVVTTPGRPPGHGGVALFPAPIGRSRTLDGGEPEWAPVEGPWAGVLAVTADRTIAVVDDAAFLDAICLAAGVACHGSRPGIHPVWERGADYVRLAEGMGLVVAETVTPPV